MSRAERTNDIELTMKIVLRPKYAASAHPAVNPMAKLKDHVVEESVFAITTSDSGTTFGITELRPGSKNDHRRVSDKSRRYSNHTNCGPLTKIMQKTMAARA